MNEPQILGERKSQTMKLMEELTPDLITDLPGPGRGNRSIASAKAAPINSPIGREANSYNTSDGGSVNKGSGGLDAALQNSIRRTVRSTKHTIVPASQPTFADNEDGDSDDSDFEPETAVATVTHHHDSNAAGRPGRAVDNESDSGSESNFHFNPDQSPDAHSFPQGVDHDDDTGAESDDGNDDIEAMDIDVSGRAAPLVGPGLASYAHAAATFVTQVPQDFDALNAMIDSATACVNAAQAARAMFEARVANRPTASSLIGTPPSAEEVEVVRWKLKDTARMILETL
ncbi:hypothetical protein PG995_012329 [Apiospora arundinis]